MGKAWGIKHKYCLHFNCNLSDCGFGDTVAYLLTLSLSSMSLYTFLSVPGTMKSPNRIGLLGMTSSKLVPNSCILVLRSSSNQLLSSSFTSRSWNTRQLSWYHRRSSSSLSC